VCARASPSLLPDPGPERPRWRGDFELTPDNIVHHWQPLVLGLLACSQHHTRIRFTTIYTDMVRARPPGWQVEPAELTCVCARVPVQVWGAIWYVFLALFGCFGYAGNLGIISGALCLVTGALAAIMVLVADTKDSGPLHQPLV